MPEASKTYAIHPAIGVARIGNVPLDADNPATWYLGPEAPHEVPNRRHSCKAGGRMKKQAQRFRIYEYDNGVAVREVTLAAGDVAAIAWTVHLANRKAALDPGRTDCPWSTPGVLPQTYVPAKARNATVGQGHAEHGAADPRQSLAIDPGPCTIETRGTAAPAPRVISGTIAFPFGPQTRSAEVTLGTIAAERGTGRLLVFAADGLSRGLDASGAFSDGAPFGSGANEQEKAHWTYANSDGWYDDSADGRVSARITFADGTEVALDQPEQAAWVICTVPRYVPGIGSFTTLHDVAVDALAQPADLGRRPSFLRDIYPVLASISGLHWVNLAAANGHSPGKADYFQPGAMQKLADANPDPASEAWRWRNAIFAKLRQPGSRDRDGRLMPQVGAEVRDPANRDNPYDIAALTRLQYTMMQKWRDGDFVSDFDGADPAVPLDRMSAAAQPAALDRGALDGTAGTPFYPGIEAWNIMRVPEVYAAPLRLSARMRPGDLTMANALPWQADFLDCTDTWWPVQRPTNVFRPNGSRAPWIPAGWGENEDTPDFRQMVLHWSDLGVVEDDGRGRFVENDRSLGD